MITAESLYKQANISPSDFGEEIVPPDDDEATQRQKAIDHIAELIIPGAISEVSVPLMKASQGSDLPLSDAAILRRYPTIIDPDKRAAINTQLQQLYDDAVKSYARSEINKQVSSNAKEYDEDSDQDRTTADAKLQKLIDMVTDILTSEPDTPLPENRAPRPMQTVSVQTSFGF